MSDSLNIAVVGPGAIGGWIGARLAAHGHNLSALARGATLESLRRHGFRLYEAHQEITAPVHAAANAEALGPQDLVFLTTKGHAVGSVVESVTRLMRRNTVVVSAMNGVPWWFFAGEGEGEGAGEGEGMSTAPLESIDPAGRIAARIAARHVLGAVVHASCMSSEPGRVVHRQGNGLILGEAVGGNSQRLERIAQVLREAGFAVTVSARVQKDIWYKLWGNMTVNPISALCGATADRILDDELVSGFMLQVMAEAAEVGRRIGYPIGESGADRMQVTRRLGAFKTSMLQDAEAGRLLEIDALLAAPREIAARVNVATPAMDALLGLTRLFGRSRGLY